MVFHYLSLMGRVLNTPILESLDFLKSKRSTIDNYKSSKRLDCLILFKTNDYRDLEDLASDIQVSLSTVRRWLNKYRLVGLDEYLKKDTRERSSSIITPEIHDGLKSRLEDPLNSFKGFWDAQQWVNDTYGILVNYKTLWSYITDKLDGRIKVPRKSNIKKDKEAEAEFFKTT